MLDDNSFNPERLLSLRNLWLFHIYEGSKAIAQKPNKDVAQIQPLYIGFKSVVTTVRSFYLCLVDLNDEIRVKTDVDNYMKVNYHPQRKDIWKSDAEIQDKWYRTSMLSENLFQFIVSVLNKYDLLSFERIQGFTNTVMRDVSEQDFE